MKFSLALNSKCAATALAVSAGLAAALPLGARNLEPTGDLRFMLARHVVRPCPHERLFAAAHAVSPDGRWLIGHGTYEPAPERMVAEYRFVADSGGRRVLDRDFARTFGAPIPGSDIAWVPAFPATLRYMPLAKGHATAPSVAGQENVCKRL